MEKSVHNQKVFVNLSAVMELQKRYINTCSEYKQAHEAGSLRASLLDRKRVIEQVIDLLSLPIAHQ